MRRKAAIISWIILFILVLFQSKVYLNAALFGNESETAYEEEGTTEKTNSEILYTISGNYEIKTAIIKGGGYYFDSASKFQKFLNKVETSELSTEETNFDDLSITLNGAIGDMENARDAYYNLYCTAYDTPYNWRVITSLIFFDYDSFQYRNGLNEAIFRENIFYLSRGDVTGLYKRFYQYSCELVKSLENIKSSIEYGQIPPKQEIWRLQQRYFEVALFGQYVAEVFSQLTGR